MYSNETVALVALAVLALPVADYLDERRQRGRAGVVAPRRPRWSPRPALRYLAARVGLRIRQFLCALRGHDALLHFEQGRLSLLCSSCGYETPGWDVRGAPARPTLAPRRRRTAAVIVLLVSLAPALSAAQEQPRSVFTVEGYHFLVGENALITPAFLANHDYQSSGGSFGDNAVVADFWYDAAHRRLHSRSLQLVDVDDPADLRLGRAAGWFPNGLDFDATHKPGTVVGHIGFVGWNNNGFTAYQAAIQGWVLTQTTQGLCLTTATGVAGRNRTGSAYNADDLVCHVMVQPNAEGGAEMVVGYNSDPSKSVRLVVRGDLVVEGRITEQRTVDIRVPTRATSK